MTLPALRPAGGDGPPDLPLLRRGAAAGAEAARAPAAAAPAPAAPPRRPPDRALIVLDLRAADARRRWPAPSACPPTRRASASRRGGVQLHRGRCPGRRRRRRRDRLRAPGLARAWSCPRPRCDAPAAARWWRGGGGARRAARCAPSEGRVQLAAADAAAPGRAGAHHARVPAGRRAQAACAPPPSRAGTASTCTGAPTLRPLELDPRAFDFGATPAGVARRSLLTIARAGWSALRRGRPRRRRLPAPGARARARAGAGRGAGAPPRRCAPRRRPRARARRCSTTSTQFRFYSAWRAAVRAPCASR